MASKLYLMSGHTSRRELVGIDGRALYDADNADVLVLNMSFAGAKDVKRKEESFRKYFLREVGADDVRFLEAGASEERIDEEFGRAGLIYVPGGHSKTLISNMSDDGLDERLREFDGVISANSAGARVLCPDYLKIKSGRVEREPAFGLFDYWVYVHYEDRFDPVLRKLSKEGDVYAIGDGSAVTCTRNGLFGADREIGFIGDVHRFSEGKKKRPVWVRG